MAVQRICDFCGAGQQNGLPLAWVSRAPALCCLRFDLSTAMAGMCSSTFLKVFYPGVGLYGRENRVDRQVQA